MKMTSPYAKRRARIEIIPLIDIIFFLLATFVMVSLSMIKNEGLRVNLPAAATGTPQESKQNITISITKEGEIYLDKRRVDLDQLRLELGIWKAKESNPSVFIHGDEEAQIKNMITVMDLVRGAGITKVAVRTQPASGEKSTS